MKIIILLFLLLIPNAARSEPEATADLSQDFIPVTEDFDGARMTIFGALRFTSSNIIVILEGPPTKAVVRPKVQRMGVWINDEALTLEGMPSFYAVLSSRDVAKIADRSMIQKWGLDVDRLPPEGLAAEGFKANRRAKGLYVVKEDGVRIRDNKLFRADIDLPPNVPVGTYKASIYEISRGKLVASRTTNFQIQQIGVNGQLKMLALQKPILYALACLVMAFGVGGFATFFFRKGNK